MVVSYFIRAGIRRDYFIVRVYGKKHGMQKTTVYIPSDVKLALGKRLGRGEISRPKLMNDPNHSRKTRAFIQPSPPSMTIDA
jgi:hypothetical protein